MSQSTSVAEAPRDFIPLASVGMSAGGGHRLAPQNLAEVVKFAEVMSRAGIALPSHLQNSPGACMAVALQALDWQMNPFAVAQKSYSVNNRIAYEAQLIAAVVNTRSGIEGRLKYDYEGDGPTLKVIVSGKLDGEVLTYESPLVKDIPVKNSPLWKYDPKQQLGYFGARAWARRHCPEVILGVYDPDEAREMRDVTPTGSGFANRLQGNQGGFSAEQVASEIDQAEVPVDWLNADKSQLALQRGELPPGCVVDQSGTLNVPEGFVGKQHIPGYSVVLAHFPEIVTASGRVLKSRSGPQLPVVAIEDMDADAIRAGEQAFVDGESREAPDDYTPEQKVAFAYGFDAAGAAMGGQ